MSSIANEIVAIKTEVRKRNWEEMSLACRQNGLSVKEWCRQKWKVIPVLYLSYYHPK